MSLGDKYRTWKKAIVTFLGGLASWGVTASADNDITQVELFGLVGVLATALAVAWVTNDPTSEG